MFLNSNIYIFFALINAIALFLNTLFHFFSDPPAVFLTPDGTVTVQETSMVNITCVFDANPPDVTEIVWYKDGNRLQRDTTQRLETRHPLSAVLALFNLSRHDSGTYTCHVRNAFGRGNSTTASILNVLCKSA